MRKDIFISSLNLTTNAGAFWRTQVNTTHLKYDSESNGTSERLAGLKLRWQAPTGLLDEYTPYAIIRFMPSNRRTLIIRDYPLIYSIFANAGGVIQMMIIFSLLFVVMHREVLLETKLLNSGVLFSGSSDGDMKQSRFGSPYQNNRYTYSEVMKFKYFSCCAGKSSRFGQYKLDRELLADRLDAPTLVQNG